jgi:DedD protein
MVARQGTSREARKAEVAPAVGPVQPPAAERADLKRQLLWRMGLAGLMIVALLGVLALFDYSNAPDDSLANGQQFTEPVPVRRMEAVQPPTPAETPVDEPLTTAEEAVTETASEAISEDAGSSAAGSAAGAQRQSPPKPGSSAAADRASAVARPEPPPPPPPPQVAANPALPPAVKRTTETAAGAAATSPQPAVAEAAPVSVRLVSGYIVQSGLFADLALAEEWQARLAQEGIPSTVEARLQIGPFKNRSEAEAARRKLNELGIDTPSAVRRIGKP